MTPNSIQQVGHKARLEHGFSVFQPRCLSRCCHKWKSLRLWTKWADLRSWPENHLSNQVPSITLLHFLILPLPNKASFFFNFRVWYIKEMLSVLPLFTSSLFSPQWAWKDIGKSDCYLWLVAWNAWLPEPGLDYIKGKAGLWCSAKQRQ